MGSCENSSAPNRLQFMNLGLVPTERGKKLESEFCRLMMLALSNADPIGERSEAKLILAPTRLCSPSRDFILPFRINVMKV